VILVFFDKCSVDDSWHLRWSCDVIGWLPLAGTKCTLTTFLSSFFLLLLDLLMTCQVLSMTSGSNGNGSLDDHLKALGPVQQLGN